MPNFKNPKASIDAFYAAVRNFRGTDYDNVDELESQEDELIEVARSVVEYLAEKVAK